MTSTESLIESQRDVLLALGFRHPHGFQYTHVVGHRYVVATVVGREDEPAGQQWELEVTQGAVTDLVLLAPGVSTPTFTAVVGSLL